MTMRPVATFLVIALMMALAATGLSLLQDAHAQTPLPCFGTGQYGLVVITTTSGYKITFQNVTEDTVRSWDANRLVIGGGQTRVPYDNIIVMDTRCAPRPTPTPTPS